MKAYIFEIKKRSKGLTMHINFHSLLWYYLPRVPTILTMCVDCFCNIRNVFIINASLLNTSINYLKENNNLLYGSVLFQIQPEF